MNKLINDNCSITFNPEKKDIFGRDHTDQYNDPAFYNKSKRNLKQAWQALTQQFNDSTTYWQAIDILTTHQVKIHSYCMMD